MKRVFIFLLSIVLMSNWSFAQCNATINNVIHGEGNTAFFIDSNYIKSLETIYFDTNKIISTKIDKNPIKIDGIQFSNSFHIITDGSMELVDIKSLNSNDSTGTNTLYTINDKLITCPSKTKIDKNFILLVETKKLEEYHNTCIINLIEIKTKPSFNNKKNKKFKIK